MIFKKIKDFLSPFPPELVKDYQRALERHNQLVFRAITGSSDHYTQHLPERLRDSSRSQESSSGPGSENTIETRYEILP